MSIIIKGMKMPSGCFDCPISFEDSEGYICDVAPKCTGFELERPDWCPLVEVPTPHGRLIDADTFENFIRKDWDKNDHWIADVVYSRPTIIPAEEGE